jgi:hypothetical protein
VIAVPASNVSVNFDQRSVKNGKSCVLLIEAAPDPSYDTAKVEITVGVSADCKRERPCAGVSMGFSLINRREMSPQTTLTSATICDIPSYNRLAEGTDGTMLRGQFLEENDRLRELRKRQRHKVLSSRAASKSSLHAGAMAQRTIEHMEEP